MVSLARKIREIERHQGKFDLLLATGDLVTDGSSEAFGWCLDYLQNDEVRGGDASRAATRGLGFDPDRRILLPGNHDRFNRAWLGFQQVNTAFERAMQTPTAYPYVVGYRRRQTPKCPSGEFLNQVNQL
jgi:3',5'-cyclic AMP phosphodiesterase CpdA